MRLYSKATNRIALRIDDIGAASKHFEVHGKTRIQVANFQIPFPGNFLFLKYLKPFRSWGPYPEMAAGEWESVFGYCERHQLKLTLAVTAGWVERDGSVIPFPEKYPEQARLIKKASQNQLVEIANHGYTHCVLDGNKFLPKLFSSNRKWHREFWEWIPTEIQEQHIVMSQKILQEFFEVSVVSFVPPGNLFTDETLAIAKRHGLRYLSCNGIDEKSGLDLISIPNSQVIAFHDKDLVENGIKWFDKIEERIATQQSSFVKEIGLKLEAEVQS